MRPFSLLVKPAGGDCNLNCPYCFYRGVSSGRMSVEVLERVLLSYSALPIASHAVAFQGGEPLLMGIDFFRRSAALGPNIDFSLQTNATLVTSELAEFFAAHHWLIGVSPHWDYFVTGADRGLTGYRRLIEAGCDVNILQLVTCANVKDAAALYRHIRDDFKCNYHQYIECTFPAVNAVDPNDWERFLITQFQTWLDDGDARRVSVRHIDSLVSELVQGFPTLCTGSNDCRQYLVVESNGDVFPCDFYVQDDLRLGNILTDSWQAMLSSPLYAEFGARKRTHSDCPRNRHLLDSAWSHFRAYAIPRLTDLLANL